MADRMKCPTCEAPLPVVEGELDRPIVCSMCHGTINPVDLEPKRRTFEEDPDEDDRPRRRRYDDEDEFDEDDDGPPMPRRRRPSKSADGMAVASLVIGIVSLLMVCGCYWLTFPLSITGMILGFISRKKPNSSAFAWTGIGLSIAALVLAILMIVVFVVIQIGAGGFGPFGGPKGGGGGGGAQW